VEEVIWHVWSEASEFPQKLGWLAVAHFEREELVDELLSRRGQSPQNLDLQRCVGVSFGRRDDGVL
jgi:hypothetical protein